MRERYFHMYESFKYKECFYSAHAVRSNTLYNILSGVMVSVSIISVLIWSISKSMPTLWAIIIASAQLAQALIVKSPWADQITALKYLLPELKKLSLQIDSDWLSIDVNAYTDKKILSLIAGHESTFANLESQFTQFADFREVNSVLKKAEKDQRAYFYSKYPSTKSSERRVKANVGR